MDEQLIYEISGLYRFICFVHYDIIRVSGEDDKYRLLSLGSYS